MSMKLYPKDTEKVATCMISGEPLAEGEHCAKVGDRYITRGLYEMFVAKRDILQEEGGAVLMEMHYENTEMTEKKPENTRFYKFVVVQKRRN